MFGLGKKNVRTYNVGGMKCQHCVAHVHDAVAAVDGVKDVKVDLASGKMKVTGEADSARVIAAVSDAGYTCVEG